MEEINLNFTINNPKTLLTPLKSKLLKRNSIEVIPDAIESILVKNWNY